MLFQAVGAVVVGVDDAAIGLGAGKHGAHQLAVPRLAHQLGFGHGWGGRIADDGDEFIDIRQSDRQTFEHMAALAGLAQIEDGAPCHHLATVRQENGQQVFQVAQTRLTINQRHHVHSEGVLQLGLFIEIVQHYFGHRATFQFNDQAHTGFVRLVLNVADVFDLLFVNQLGHALLQGLFVHLVGQFVNDDGLALAFVDVLEVAFGPHDHAAASSAIAFFHPADAIDDAGSGEVRGRHDVHQVVDRGVGVTQQVQTRVHHLVQVVRGNVGRHAHGDTGRAIDQQIGEFGRHDQRFFFASIVVGTEINGFFVQIVEQFVRDFGQTDLGVAHGGGVVTVNRTKVTLPIHQHVAQGKILRHANNGVIDRAVAVRVVFANDVTHDARRLLIWTIPVIVQLVHREQHAAVNRLQAVAGVGEGTTDDDAHGVIEVAAAHFLF